MALPSLTDINNLLGVVAVNDYNEKVLKHFTPMTDPYQPFIPVGTWDSSRGLNPVQLRGTSELPTAMPGAGTALAQNDGSGDAHAISATTVQFGRQTRSTGLYRWAFQTNTYSVRDFAHDVAVMQFIEQQQQGLRKYQNQFITDWKRQRLCAMTDLKVSITGTDSTSFSEVSNADDLFTGLDDLYANKPTAPLNWGPLETIRNLLYRVGASEYAVGVDELGNPVFPLIVGPTTAARLFRDTDKVAQAINYNQSYDSLTPYGRRKATFGFMPVVDLEIPRFTDNDGNDGFDNVYPWINETISSNGSGRRYARNPDYATAEYEIFYIPTRAQFEMLVQPAPGTQFSVQSYNKQNFAGNLQWINNPDMANNPLGDKGFYYLENSLAAKPLLTDMGVVGLGLRVG